jgi:hypothetical protein
LEDGVREEAAVQGRRGGRFARCVALAVGLGAVALGVFVSIASADFGFVPGSFAASTASTQAGAHADLITSFSFNSHPDPAISGAFNISDGITKDVVVNTPPGLVGNPQTYPKCSYDELGSSSCPADSQLGAALVSVEGFPVVWQPVYNMVPADGHVAEFGMKVLELAQAHIVASVRTGGDYGITATVPNIASNLSLLGTTLTLWGVPADSSHDGMRGDCLTPFGPSGSLCPSDHTQLPFLSNPTQCDTAGITTITADTWTSPGAFLASVASVPEQMTGCDLLSFNPSVTFQPQDRRAAVPSAYTVDVHEPQNDSVTGLATAALKTAVVTLPEGLTVSPSAADGLQGCSDAQIGLDNAKDPTCPDQSKIGSVEIKTALLPAPIDGAVYQGTQTPGHLLRIFIVAKGFGVLVKVPGSIDLNPSTGQITTTVDNTPQVPFDDFILSFKGGARAPLSNPRTCGKKTTTATFTSYSGQTVLSTDSFGISNDGNGAPCPPFGFNPSFIAGTSNPVAGGDAQLITQFSRTDQDQELSGVDVTMPRGLLGRIASIVPCPDGAANAGACQDDVSKIGTATVAAGPGSNPFFITDGKVYITGPYKGAPYGLSVVVHAKAGPLDLGNVVVRAKILIDRATAQLRVVTDPFPTILQGIPLQLRLADVTIDRPAFTFNPTSCAVMAANAKIVSTEGAVANKSTRFQVEDCAALEFNPKIALSVGAKGHTASGTSVPFSATVRMPKGGVNLRSVSVTLPTILNARLPVVNQACSLADFQAGHCTSKAKVGTAVVLTPLLRDPLRGSVYFVKNPARVIPDLMVALRGPVDLDVTSKVAIPGGKALGTRFDTIPDAPFTKFTLRFVSGANGPLGAAANLCTAHSHAATASIGMRAQNGRLITLHPHLHINGCPRR